MARIIFHCFFFVFLLAVTSCTETSESDVFITTVASPGIIPQPNHLVTQDRWLVIDPESGVYADSLFAQEAAFLSTYLNERGISSTLQNKPSSAQFRFTFSTELPKEAYEIECTNDQVNILAGSKSGAFYAVQSLIQLTSQAELKEKGISMPAVTLKDEPRFKHRGMLFDCCRHFMTVDFVKRYIDLLAYYKMNVLHWHLTEDQGWRVAVEAYPKLTEVGAYRTELDGSVHGGFYTKSEMQDVVAYAAERHITVIPEIEMPGHSSAAIAAYPWLGCTGEQIEVENEWGVFKDIYCAGNDSTIRFLEVVLDEMCEIFPSEYIHIGGDEAPKTRWETCSKCQKRIAENELEDEHHLQSWMIQHFVNYLGTKGRKTVGWDEILEGGLPEGAVVQSWRGFDGGIKAAQSGHEVIMSPTSHAYFDYPIKSTDVKEVYSFDPVPEGLTPTEEALIIGGECNMWTEHAPQERVDFQMFPRLLAMSEVLWTDTSNLSEKQFFSKLNREYADLRAMGVAFGIEAVPVTVSPIQMDGAVSVQLLPQIQDAEVQWKLNSDEVWSGIEKAPMVTADNELLVRTLRWGESYGDTVVIPLSSHKALWTDIQLPNGYSTYYTGGGDKALVDGVRGTQDFRDGRWQALQGDDLVAEIRLDTVATISSLSTQFYTYSNAWIFMPTQLKVEVLNEAGKWQSVASVENPLEVNDRRQDVVKMVAQFDEVNAVGIRVTAVNRGICPDWHDAPGEPAWLFCDELVLR